MKDKKVCSNWWICFEDEEMYGLSGYFLLRAIMRMHSNECKDGEEQG